MKKIAIIEDDKLLNQALSIALTQEGYKTFSGYTVREARQLLSQKPDLLLLDRNLPDGDGLLVCREIAKQSQIPILFLTARDEEEDMLEAYDSGCEDYVVKPFSMDVLKKRIAVILRRKNSDENLFYYQELTLDFAKKQVFLGGSQIKITAKEYQLLEYMVQNKGQILTKEMILAALWDKDGNFVEENTLAVTINRLRKKIEPDSANPTYIRNVFGMGYLFGEN